MTMAGNISRSHLDPSLGEEMSLGIRSLFYLVTPAESSFKDMKSVPPYLVKATPYFFGLMFVELLVLVARGQGNKMRANDVFSSLAAGIISQSPRFVIRGFEATLYLWMYESYHLVELPYDQGWSWVVALLGTDLCFYWAHRMSHEINFLWSAHFVHHSSEDYNMSTALRQPAMARYTAWMFYMPLPLIVPPGLFIAHMQLNVLYQFWIHTQVIHKLPAPLEWVLNTPSHHRVHHGRNRYCIDKNYAGVLIIWDKLFGTFVPERDNEEIAYGTVHTLQSWDALYGQYGPMVDVFKTARRTDGLLNKVWVFLKGPGWSPGKPRLGNITDIPDIRGPQERYDKTLSWSMTAYVWLHMILTLVAIDHTGRNFQSWSVLTSLTAVLLITWNLANIGYFYEHKWYAPQLELLRCLFFVIADTVMISRPNIHPTMMDILRLVFYVSTLIWLTVSLRSRSGEKSSTKYE